MRDPFKTHIFYISMLTHDKKNEHGQERWIFLWEKFVRPELLFLNTLRISELTHDHKHRAYPKHMFG